MRTLPKACATHGTMQNAMRYNTIQYNAVVWSSLVRRQCVVFTVPFTLSPTFVSFLVRPTFIVHSHAQLHAIELSTLAATDDRQFIVTLCSVSHRDGRWSSVSCCDDWRNVVSFQFCRLSKVSSKQRFVMSHLLPQTTVPKDSTPTLSERLSGTSLSVTSRNWNFTVTHGFFFFVALGDCRSHAAIRRIYKYRLAVVQIISRRI